MMEGGGGGEEQEKGGLFGHEKQMGRGHSGQIRKGWHHEEP